VRRAFWIVGLAWVLVGCGARSAVPPEPGYERGGIPDLAGARVMVLPVQLGGGAFPELDTEIAYAFDRTGDQTTWLFAEELDQAISRNPGFDLAVRNLPVRALLAPEVERLGDPVFAQVYRLAALTSSGYALLPIEARETAGSAGVFIELTATLVDTRSGFILWLGVVRGAEAPEGDVLLAATVAEALALEVAP